MPIANTRRGPDADPGRRGSLLNGTCLLYINSPGGSITAGLAIYDTMQFVEPDVQTYCIGQAASMAVVLLTAGAKNKRFSLPNSRILIHQPWMSGLAGQEEDRQIAGI